MLQHGGLVSNAQHPTSHDRRHVSVVRSIYVCYAKIEYVRILKKMEYMLYVFSSTGSPELQSDIIRRETHLLSCLLDTFGVFISAHLLPCFLCETFQSTFMHLLQISKISFYNCAVSYCSYM